jgi:hypothetical protein
MKDKMIPGCYCLYCKNELINDYYVGQSIHLSNRFKRHAKDQEISTSDFIKSLDDNGLVDLFIIPKTINLYGLKINQFLCVLEQFLFFIYEPNFNNS